MVDVETVAYTVVQAIKAAFATIGPRLAALEAKALTPGPSGRDGERGPDGPPGSPGPVGRDGLPGVQGPQGDKGLDGRHGVDGRDALGFDDIKVLHDGERKFTFQFQRGEEIKTFGAFTIPCVIFRGVYTAGREYEKGDSVTFGGSQWIALNVTRETPGQRGVETAWVLSVKRGADGKQGPEGQKGRDGQDGRAGRDLTQIAPSGHKW
jgi:Collagen triple helix repeat (20 copies)